MRFAACLCVALATATYLAVAIAGPGPARLLAQNLSRAQIRSMPIEARPDRPIHFYGNAVRRRHDRAAPAAPARPRPAR